MAVTAGIVGAVGSVASAGSGILGGIMGRKSAANAASQAQGYLNQALQFQEGVYNTASTNITPYITGGQEALGGLEQFAGLAPSGGATGAPGGSGALASFNQFTKTPYYTFPLSQSISTMDRAAAAKGLSSSGGELAGLGQMAGNYASGGLMQYIQALQGLAGMGLSGSGTLGQIGANIGQQVGATSVQQGGVAIGAAQAQQAANQQTLGGIGNLLSSLGSGGGPNAGSQGLINVLNNAFGGGAAANTGSSYGTPLSAASQPGSTATWFGQT
jgi:type II secretory pathway pseudopilin PulG